ncbi:DUF3592 domain-containing protein [Chitinophaga sp. Cy-1792]|uniref:DUF3592 domain-containing protein n=1 Tax=Chitinophaga sp. Cy-1792 TaxID=2608339 RepID=UPI001421F570|nr:DUF3592 domain-containing protein [Chitinophaga sp. Cy-1792]NIG55484.1 DUF3592 domain-containing protein [Chitinophaga sp. Cy-1792]
MFVTLGILLGCGLLLHAFYHFLDCHAFVRAGVKATATVIAIESEPDIDYGHLYVPTFKFSTDKGEVHTFRGEGGPKRRWQPDAITDIIYDPNQPERAKVYTVMGLYKPVVVNCVIAMITFAIVFTARSNNH